MSTDDPLSASQGAQLTDTQQGSLPTQTSTAAVSDPSQPSNSNTTGSNILDDTLPPTQAVEDEEADLDAQISTEPIPDPMNMDGTSDIPPPAAAALPNGVPTTTTTNNSNPNPTTTHHPAVIEPRIPQKKDASLREFLSKMDDYAPLIPDAVTDYYLTVAGLPPPPETDRRLARLLALATQKFIADVAADAYQYSRIRSTNTTSNNPLTGLGGAAGFGTMNMPPQAGGSGQGGGEGGEGGAGKGKKDAGKAAPLGGPRAGYGGGGAGGGGQGRTVLTMEDLGMAVGEYGVNVKRGEFYR